MSRSYKKYPILRQEKEDYKILNRKIRRDKYFDNHTPSAFKRHDPHWNSWAYRLTKEQAIQCYNKREQFNTSQTLSEYLNEWRKWVVRK